MRVSVNIPNFFTYLVFTRLITFKIESKTKERFTLNSLEKYLESFKGIEFSGSNTLYLKLQVTDKVHLFLTEEMLDELIVIFCDSRFKDFQKIEDYIEDGIEYSIVFPIFEFFKARTGEINELRKNKYNSIDSDLKLYGLKDLLEENGIKLQQVLDFVNKRAFELIEVEPIEILGVKVSVDEYNLLQLLNLFNEEIPFSWFSLLENSFSSKTFNFKQVRRKLLKKRLIGSNELGDFVYKRLPSNLSPESIDNLKHTISNFVGLIEQDELNSINITRLVFLLQSVGNFEDSDLYLNRYWSLIKHSGRYNSFSTILNRQLKNEEKEGIVDPWKLWTQVKIQTYMGNIENAIMYYVKLIQFFDTNCKEKKGVKSEYLELYYKIFQLGIDISIVGGNVQILEKQFEVVRYFTIRYLLNSEVSNQVSSMVRLQILSSLALYLNHMGDSVNSKEILTNLKEEFYVEEKSLILANVLVNYLEVFPENLELIKHEAITKAFVFFRNKNNFFGTFITSLWKATILTDSSEIEASLARTLHLYKKIDGYYPYSIKLIEELMPKINSQGLIDQLNLLLLDLKKKKDKISLDIKSFPDLSILLGSYDVLASVNENEGDDIFGAKQIKLVIKELSLPSYRKTATIKSPGTQSLLNSDISIRKKFLSNTLNKLGNDYYRFYLNVDVKMVLTKSLHWRHEYKYLLHFYFSDERISEIRKLRNPEIILDYARSLTRLMPKGSKRLLDVLPHSMRNAEYFTLLGNYYSFSDSSYFSMAIECYTRAQKLCDSSKPRLLARIKTSLGFHLVSGKYYDLDNLKWAEKLFWEAIDIYTSPKYSYYPYIGVLYLRILKNPLRVNEGFIIQQLEYLKLNKEEMIYVLDQFLLGDKKFPIGEYSSIFSVFKSLNSVKIPEL